MNDYPLTQDLNNKEQERKNKIYFTNVFSRINKSEKDKQYQKLQNNLNILDKDVKLLGDYANRDNMGKKKRFRYVKANALSGGNQYKKFIGRFSVLLKKKMNARNSNPLSIITNNANSLNKSKSNNSNSSNKHRNIKGKKSTKAKNDNMIYKTEVNKYPKYINGNKLPKITLTSDKSETNMDTSMNMNNISNSSRLPTIQNKPHNKKLYIYTNNEEKQNDLKLNKNYYRQFYIQNKNVNSSNNSFIQKFPAIINNQRLKSSINRNELSNSSDKVVKMMQERNIRIKNGINYKLAEQNLIDWEMKSKIKLAQWKFGIAEIEKYFVDLRAYGKPEEEELLKRKTFYDVVEDLIDEIKKEKEEKDIKKIKNAYKKEEKKSINNLEKKEEEKDQEKNSDLNMVDNAMNKHAEESGVLKKIKNRRINEERKRHLINNILVQSELRRRAINRSTDKLMFNKYNKDIDNNYNEIMNYQQDKQGDIIKRNKNNPILINSKTDYDKE